MKLKRHGAAAAALLAAGALLLSACGSNPTSGTSSGAGAQVNCGGKQNISAAGSTAQRDAIDAFVAAFTAKCQGQNLAYNASGSGAGIKDFNAGLVDFAGSDSALSAEKGEVAAAAARCKNNPAWHIPMVAGPIAVAYKLDGVSSLVLNGETTAKIFSGVIKTWNDPAIAALNSGAALPATPIGVIFRSDESGTTDNFQQYLEAAGKGAWTKGAGKKFTGGVGSGAEKSDGVAQAVAGANGSITYVEAGVADKAKLGKAKIDNGSGPVELNAANVGKALEAATIKGTGNDLVIDIKSVYGSTAAGAYPLMLVTYEIVCSKGYEPDVAQAVKAFLTVAGTDGQAKLKPEAYPPLPDAFKTKVLAAVQAIA